MCVLVPLNEQKKLRENDRHPHECDGPTAMVFTQGVVRDVSVTPEVNSNEVLIVGSQNGVQCRKVR
jgi:hypothetical protein